MESLGLYAREEELEQNLLLRKPYQESGRKCFKTLLFTSMHGVQTLSLSNWLRTISSLSMASHLDSDLKDFPSDFCLASRSATKDRVEP